MREYLVVEKMVELSAIEERVNAPRPLTSVPLKEVTVAAEILPQIHRGSDYPTLGKNAGDNRDDPQERIRALVWLGCALECEGTFTLQYNEMEEDGGLKSYIQPRVILVNSDMKIIAEADRLMQLIGFGDIYRRDNIVCGIGLKKKTEIAYLGKKSLPFLKMLRPYIVGGKSECVDCIIEFIEYRQSLKPKNKPYSDYEYGLFNRVRAINSGHWRRKPKFSALSSETVRRRREDAWKRSDVMIQSGLNGDIQNSTETIESLMKKRIKQRQRMYPDYEYQE